MEIDVPGESNGVASIVKENGFQLFPVSIKDSGEGFPYAPVDWPNPGDTWSWRVGNRITPSGFFTDRYLYPPSRFQVSTRRKGGFKSKLSVQQYIEAEFPGADVGAFFASFSWKIPAKILLRTPGCKEELRILTAPSEEVAQHSGFEPQFGAVVCCKASNKMCSSLVEARNSPLEAMACDLCCSEPGFCRDCCCILCCKTINPSHEGHSFIMCEAVVGEGIICGHIAHVHCAIRSYMAGTVGGSIGLDAEYYCRRCDTRTDLVSHVTKLLGSCDSIDSQDDMENIINVASCILRGSKKTSAKSLLRRMELTMEKLKSGTCSEDIWEVEGISGLSDAIEVTNYQEPLDFETGSPQTLSANFDLQNESLKLEAEIDHILQGLRKAQDSGYKIAEERLCAQKNHLLNLYQQLDKEKSEPWRQTSSKDPDALDIALVNRLDQIKREMKKLRDIEEMAKGFGETCKDIWNGLD